jgi:4-diphosphocytidyl-2-C-methyl-D-erythritol kinase
MLDLERASTGPGCLMTSLIIHSFAKLNIALDVLDKRPDGYHNIESVIQSISLQDTLTISKRDDETISVRATDPAVPSGEGNLAHGAAVLFLEACRLNTGVDIEIDKRIPAQAGLGGGSSNAAATLTGMNRLFGNPLSAEQLHTLCSQLGSDVPFFLSGGTGFVSGRGEIVSELPDVALDFIVVKPEFGISTAWAYDALSSQPRPPVYASRAVAEAIRRGDRAKVVSGMGNDFERVADSAFPEIAAIRTGLMALGADGAMLAGSGSAVFGAFLDSTTCDSAYATIKASYPQAVRARTILRGDCR